MHQHGILVHHLNVTSGKNLEYNTHTRILCRTTLGCNLNGSLKLTCTMPVKMPIMASLHFLCTAKEMTFATSGWRRVMSSCVTMPPCVRRSTTNDCSGALGIRQPAPHTAIDRTNFRTEPPMVINCRIAAITATVTGWPRMHTVIMTGPTAEVCWWRGTLRGWWTWTTEVHLLKHDGSICRSLSATVMCGTVAHSNWQVSSLIHLLLLKTLQFKTVCKDDSGYVTQLKQQKSKKVILLSSTLPHSQCADK